MKERGVTYDVGDRFAQLRERFPKTIATHAHAIQFAPRELGSLGVKQLEPLATALFVTRQHPGLSAPKRSAKLLEIKPHVTQAEATAALETIDSWISESAA